jgi:cytochrome c-type biogenesis protein CcmH
MPSTLEAVKRLAILAAAATLVAAVPAQGAPRAVSFNDIEDEVMCVVCGTPLNLSESPQADRERAYIRRLIAQGDSKAQIKDKLKAQYGPAVLALPQDSGFDLAAYVVPIALFVVALFLLVLFVPRWRRRSPEPVPAAGHTISAADRRRLDEDLAKFDQPGR